MAARTAWFPGCWNVVPCFRPRKHVRVVSSVVARGFLLESPRHGVIVVGMGPELPHRKRCKRWDCLWGHASADGSMAPRATGLGKHATGLSPTPYPKRTSP
jgi:hypothetical protein